MASSEESSLFVRQKINFQPPSPITHLLACNNQLVLAMQNGKVRLIPLDNPEKQEELEAISPSVRDTVAYIHLDPTGQHFLVTTSVASDVCYYLKSQNKFKNLSKMKGNVVSAVGWNQELSKPTSTGFILFGTTRGLLFEGEITSAGNLSYFKQLYNFSDDPNNPVPIVSLHMHRCSSNSKENKWFIFATVPGRLYPIAGIIGNSTDSSVFQTVFSTYEETLPRFHSLTSSDVNADISELCLHPQFGDEPASRFAWLAGAGLEYGSVDCSSKDALKMIVPEKLYNYPMANNGRSDLPLHFVMTEYHFLLLYNERVSAICSLNEQLMYEDVLGQKFGKLIGICRDPISGFVWIYSDRTVLKYSPTNETKYLWSIHLERGNFSLARKFASDNPKNFDIVLQKQAAKLMDEKKFVAAAEVYAMTKAPFEDISLKFVQSEDRTALKTFLQKKLDSLKEEDKTQKSMIVFWLLEILLTELNEAESGSSASRSKTSTTPEIDSQPRVMDSQKIKSLREYFRMFLNKSDVMACLRNNPQAVVQMLSSHGDIESLLYFSDLMKDYESVIAYHIQQEEYDKALSVLKRQKNAELFYKYSPTLITVVAQNLIEAWISMESFLKPKFLLTAMFQCEIDRSAVEEVVKYLELFISKFGCSDQAVHNYLITLYSKFCPMKLMPYLETQGKDPAQITYDLKFALRICTEKNLPEPCVYLYVMMGMYEEAMRLALKVTLDLAKTCAKSPENLEIRRKLWLLVARHVVEKEQDIKKCVDLLQESDGLIKIQDLLPFFPNFVTIDHFKESLCTCLAEHSGKIKGLQDEMKEAGEVAQQINKQIETSKNKYVTLKVQEKCSHCAQPLMVRSFYAFPCRHNFHSDCIEKEVEPLLSNEFRSKLKHLKTQLNSLRHVSDDSVSLQSSSSYQFDKGASKRDEIFREIDDILGSDCPFCGDAMIRSVGLQFFTPSEYVTELKKWE